MNRQLYNDANEIIKKAHETGQRTGQALFNELPNPVSSIVAGTLFDPFHRDMAHYEIVEWISSHLIFDGQEIIAVFNQDQLLWTSEPDITIK